MANPTGMVSLFQSVGPAPVGLTSPLTITVHLHGGTSALLDATRRETPSLADMLRDLSLTNEPAYLEVDPATPLIHQTLFPSVLILSAIANVTD